MNRNEVLELYEIIKHLYTNRVKLPIKPISYFLELYESTIGKVFVVLHGDKVIGGAFCLFYPKLSINTMYYAGVRDYHKKIFATHLAIMGIIEFAIENNLKMVDFMGAGKPDEAYGVRDYKLQFGGNLKEDGRFKIIFKPVMYKIGEFGIKILSKIK